ncbi:alpha/beta hydrolase [Ramlibacter sp. USB13]|uniref:Alpha/beta hydrolase n=1 Tax=Ramlibacter cellulosilyticus TaxID=2764187 RepID=A0A923SA18_9BURK|nr:alpha/beta hydrolase [Ramlibacter cellulosilyticus]MBC5782306.1 alpha/beta hydrolase [Ramlibacter cellulosilyticus]
MPSSIRPSSAWPDRLELPGQPPMRLRVQGDRRTAMGRVVLHLHGGAYTSGGLDSGACLAGLLADAGAMVVSIAYPLAPEHRFPDAVEAGHAALEWVHANRTRIAGAKARVFLAGEEAGGNLAAAIALMARDRAAPPLAGLVLVTPMLDPCTATASQREAAGEQVQCRFAEGWKQYLRSPRDAEHPYAVPAYAQRLAGLPPTLVLAGEDDPMRDEAMAFAGRLQQAGVSVHTGLIPATGWPASLERPPEPCPCAVAVQEQFARFYAAPVPQPS